MIVSSTQLNYTLVFNNMLTDVGVDNLIYSTHSSNL